MKSLARLSTRSPLLILSIWAGVLIATNALSLTVGSNLRDEFSLPGSDSQQAVDLIEEHFPQAGSYSDLIVVKAADGQTLSEGETATRLSELFGSVEQLDTIASVTRPSQNPAQVSADGTIAYALVNYESSPYNSPLSVIEHIQELVDEADSSNFTVAFGGKGADRLTTPEVGPAEMIGVVIAAIILVIAFGSLVAASVPLISAGFALGSALAVLNLISNIGPLSTSAPTIAVLLGLGLGIDYGLFIVNRHRSNLLAGMPLTESIHSSVRTSGRAVVFAGITVAIALAGMFVPGLTFLNGLAIAAILATAFSVLSSITVVPAVLKLFGNRVLSRKERTQLASPEPTVTLDKVRRDGKVRSFVYRRPITAGLSAVALLGVLAIPAASMWLGISDQGNSPRGTSTRIAYDTMSEGFGPGANGPMVLTVQARDNATLANIPALIEQIQTDAQVVGIEGPLLHGSEPYALLNLLPLDSPQAEETADLVERLRNDYNDVAHDLGLNIHVAGSTSADIDMTASLRSSLPAFLATVVGLSVLVLTLTFRSVLLPLFGALLNLLAAAASFGVVVAIFQWGWLHQLVGVGEGGPIEPFVPIIMFALLFGLSMDYQVFLVSRIAEIWQHTRDSRRAVVDGLREVSRVIVSAASIMIAVFASFGGSDSRMIKMLGIGLAVAIFLDAFVIRTMIMPALMLILGKSSWWIPRWLDKRLPHLDVEGTDASTQVPQERELALQRT